MSDADIARAQVRADLARVRLSDALAALKQRLLPKTIARRLVVTTKDKAVDAAEAGVDAVKARPALAVGAAALAALFLARKPIVRAISGDDQETPAKPPRSRAKPARKAKP